MSPPRLTRKESQARTRERLIQSAAKAFAKHGLEQTSVERVAEGAGYTKGAFYANFKSKEELCLTMLERRFDAYLEQFDRLLATDEQPEERARRAGDHFSGLVEADPQWQRLSFEFAVYAMRNEGFRRELVARYRSLRERIAEVFRVRAEEMNVEPPIPLERLVLMTFAMSNGAALGKLLEPETFSDELYGSMLTILFTGLRALVEAED
jgi:AcrR family transcriptional regulator